MTSSSSSFLPITRIEIRTTILPLIHILESEILVLSNLIKKWILFVKINICDFVRHTKVLARWRKIKSTMPTCLWLWTVVKIPATNVDISTLKSSGENEKYASREWRAS
jgi:hypothetical protein